MKGYSSKPAEDLAQPPDGPAPGAHVDYLKLKAECQGNQSRCTLAKEGKCPLFGTLGKAGRDGNQRVRGCGDPSAMGKRSKQKGQRKQAKAVTALGIPRSSIHPGHEEYLPGSLRLEVKATKREAGPVMTAYLRCEMQSEAARPIGDHRPFAAVMMPDGTKDGLVVVRLSNLHEFVAAMVENWDVA